MKKIRHKNYKRFTCGYDPDCLKVAEEIALRADLPVAQILRMALDEKLEKLGVYPKIK